MTKHLKLENKVNKNGFWKGFLVADECLLLVLKKEPQNEKVKQFV